MRSQDAVFFTGEFRIDSGCIFADLPQDPELVVVFMIPCCFRSCSCRGLGVERLNGLVGRSVNVDGLLSLLPYIQALVNLEAVPNNGCNEKADGPACFDVADIQAGAIPPPPVLGHWEVGWPAGPMHVDVMEPSRHSGFAADKSL